MYAISRLVLQVFWGRERDRDDLMTVKLGCKHAQVVGAFFQREAKLLFSHRIDTFFSRALQITIEFQEQILTLSINTRVGHTQPISLPKNPILVTPKQKSCLEKL